VRKPPSRQEKEAAMREIINDIQQVMEHHDCEIFVSDESHFSTEPYLIRGWFKKRWPPQDSNKLQARKSHILWMLKSGDSEILLEEVKAI
jgi:hypothetical protein